MRFFSKKQKNKAIQKSWQGKSSNVRSMGAKREEKKRERKFSRFLFWMLLFGFFGICAYLLLFSPFLDIDAISVEGNQDISSADIIDRAKQSIEGKYFNYLPQKNFFLANENSINNAVRTNFNRLEVESIEKKFPNTIIVKVVERKAELVWCSAGVCYFADKSGLAYGGAAGTEEELLAKNFLVVIDDSAIPVEIGKTKIDPQCIESIEAVNSMIRDNLKINPAGGYHTPGIASKEIGVRTGEGWILKLGLAYPVEDTKKIIQTLFEKDLNEETRKKLDYLDLRIKNKIYYKIKQEETNDSIEE